MRVRAILEAGAAGTGTVISCYAAFIQRATLAAVAVRHHSPNAWYASMITWYAEFALLGFSIVMGVIAYRIVYKHEMRSNRRS